jgi:hypothetical protein
MSLRAQNKLACIAGLDGENPHGGRQALRIADTLTQTQVPFEQQEKYLKNCKISMSSAPADH